MPLGRGGRRRRVRGMDDSRGSWLEARASNDRWLNDSDAMATYCSVHPNRELIRLGCLGSTHNERRNEHMSRGSLFVGIMQLWRAVGYSWRCYLSTLLLAWLTPAAERTAPSRCTIGEGTEGAAANVYCQPVRDSSARISGRETFIVSHVRCSSASEPHLKTPKCMGPSYTDFSQKRKYRTNRTNRTL